MTLLPPNATAMERAIDQKQALRITGIDVPIRHLWNPDLCPEPLLPWLAWAVSVDEWNPDWDECQRRQMIKRSPMIHRNKGTRSAVESILGGLGFTVEIIEWWEKEPKGTPGTFDLSIEIPAGYQVNSATYSEVERLVEQAKNKRSHIGKMSLSPKDLDQAPIFSAAITSGIVTTVYPLGRIGAGDDV